MKKALVIGATSGIGRMMAERLIKAGYRVGITGRREHLLQSLQQEFPLQICYRSFDVQQTTVAQEKIQELIRELGGIDLLVYSSGNGEINKALSFEKELNIIQTNVVGFVSCITFVFNYMAANGGGQIAAITSISGLRGNPEYAAYFSTKGFQIQYLESLRIKSKQEKLNIIITELRPGFINTVDVSKVSDAKIFWITPVEKATLQMMDAIRKKREVAYISKRWILIGIVMKILPRWVWDRLPF
jgi:short-subunit dehydrogenase